MKEPATTLDKRFSDPNAVRDEWDETRRVLSCLAGSLLSGPVLLHSLRCGFRRHPLLHRRHRAGGQSESQSARHSDDGCNQWDTGLDVVVEGDAIRGI